MALDFGWRVVDPRESIWRGDPALGPVPADVLERWEDDGEASHLLPYVRPGEHPTTIRVRTLTQDESHFVQGIVATAGADGIFRAWLACFRMAVSFEGLPEKINGNPTHVTERGFRMMADPLVAYYAHAFPGITYFYGAKVYSAAIPSEAEKKASSPPSTPTPSSGAASTKADDTAPSEGAA